MMGLKQPPNPWPLDTHALLASWNTFWQDELSYPACPSGLLNEIPEWNIHLEYQSLQVLKLFEYPYKEKLYIDRFSAYLLNRDVLPMLLTSNVKDIFAFAFRLKKD